MSEEALAGRSFSQTPSRARLAALLVLVALLPLLALAWVAATGVGRSETRKADLRLESEGRSASAVFARSVAEASSRAGSLAASPALQRALVARDRARLRRLTGPSDVVTAGGKVLSGRPEPLAVHRTASVVVGGRPVGSVTVNVPLNGELLRSLRSEVGLNTGDRLVLVRNGRAIAGAITGPALVPVARSLDRSLGGTNYRVYGVRLVGPPDNVELLPVILRATMDATGAVGGRLVQRRTRDGRGGRRRRGGTSAAPRPRRRGNRRRDRAELWPASGSFDSGRAPWRSRSARRRRSRSRTRGSCHRPAPGDHRRADRAREPPPLHGEARYRASACGAVRRAACRSCSPISTTSSA